MKQVKGTKMRFLFILLSFIVIGCPIPPLNLDVYKLRLNELFKSTDEKVASLDLVKKFTETIDTASSTTYWREVFRKNYPRGSE